jgi:hypothetical protein
LIPSIVQTSGAFDFEWYNKCTVSLYEGKLIKQHVRGRDFRWKQNKLVVTPLNLILNICLVIDYLINHILNFMT